MRMTEVEQAVAQLAARQHGVFNAAQAIAVGASRDWLSRATLSGRLVRLHPGVYAAPGAPRTLESRALAAAWSVSGSVSHATAAHLWGMPGGSGKRLEVTVTRGGTRSRDFVLHESSLLPAADTTSLGLLPVTTRERTLVDLAGRWSEDHLARVTEDLLAERAIRVERLERTALPHIGRGHAGSIALARIVDRHARGAEVPRNELERALSGLLGSGRWGQVVEQATLPIADGARVDALLVDLAVIVEADGRRWHTRTADFARDRRRDREAGMLGLHVARFTYAEIVHDCTEVERVLDGHLARRRAA